MEAIFADYLAAWSSHDADRVASFFTNDCVFEDMAFGVVMHGKEEVNDFVRVTLAAYPDFAMKLTFGFGTGHRFASEWVMTGTHTGSMTGAPATGNSFSVRGASVTEFDRDKIKRNTDYWSLSLLLQQLRLPGSGLQKGQRDGPPVS